MLLVLLVLARSQDIHNNTITITINTTTTRCFQRGHCQRTAPTAVCITTTTTTLVAVDVIVTATAVVGER